MGTPSRESGDSKPSKGELPNTDPSRNDPLRDASRRTGSAPLEKTSETIEPPLLLGTARRVVEGDAAAVELRLRLARARDETLLPAARRSSPRQPAAAPRFVGLLLVAAASAGAGGYLLGGFGLPARLPPAEPSPASLSPGDATKGKSPRAASGEATVVLPPLPPATNPGSANRDSRMPAAQTAAIDLAPADARPTPGDGGARPPAPPVRDPAEVAAKMKIGADLMTSGDIAAARTMFERVAEAGEAAGAFALAETYDPAVLKTLRLRGAIKADLALAQRWYEKARDMGSTAAIERIARLTRSSR